MFPKFVKTKQNEVKLFKILQDRSKTNIFVSNCVEEKKENTKLRFLGGKSREKAKKNEYNRSSTIEDLPLLIRTRMDPHHFMKLDPDPHPHQSGKLSGSASAAK